MSRHGKIAEGKTLLSANIEAELKDELRLLAKDENRTLSNFVVTTLREIVAAKKAERKMEGAKSKLKKAADKAARVL